MAGKLHVSYLGYTTAADTAINPATKLSEAYAEGFNAFRATALRTTNPHPAWQTTIAGSDWQAWDAGWMNASTGYPPTHVG